MLSNGTEEQVHKGFIEDVSEHYRIEEAGYQQCGETH